MSDITESSECIARFQNVFPRLSKQDKKRCISCVRDNLRDLVGPPEVVLMSGKYTTEELSKELYFSGLGISKEAADGMVSSLKKGYAINSDAIACAVDILLGYFYAARFAEQLTDETDVDSNNMVQTNINFTATQIALLYFSGTPEVEKHAH